MWKLVFKLAKNPPKSLISLASSLASIIIYIFARAMIPVVKEMISKLQPESVLDKKCISHGKRLDLGNELKGVLSIEKITGMQPGEATQYLFKSKNDKAFRLVNLESLEYIKAGYVKYLYCPYGSKPHDSKEGCIFTVRRNSSVKINDPLLNGYYVPMVRKDGAPLLEDNIYVLMEWPKCWR